MKKLIIILLVFIGLNTQATTYYISTTGSNSNNGSSNSPWLTLNYACAHATTSGDIIHVNSGTYTETTQINLAVGVSIIGEGLTSIIKSTLTADWVPIISLESTTMADGNQSISYLNFDGNSTTTTQAILIRGRSNVTVNHCNFKDFKYRAVQFDAYLDTSSSSPRDNNNEGVLFSSLFLSDYRSGNTFHDNIVTNCAGYATGGAGQGALMISGQIGMLIYNNNINQSGRTAGTNGWPIKTGDWGAWLKGCKIYDNILFKDDLTNWEFAIEMYCPVEGLEIYNNTITGSIDINNALKGSYDYGLYIHNNTIGPLIPASGNYRGVVLEYSVSDVIITKNEIRNCAVGVCYSPREGTVIADNEISYNIIHDVGTGSHFYAAILIPNSGYHTYTVTRINIYNNVIHANTSSSASAYFGFECQAPITYLNIVNNIFVNFNAQWMKLNPSSVDDYINIKNNISYNNGSSNAINFVTGNPSHYINSGSLASNPLFVSATDFHLQSGSPAIDTGVGVGLTTDYEGNPIPINGVPDIGAYEFGITHIVNHLGSPIYHNGTIIAY